MTVVNPKSISGITSITTASGSDNLLTIHTSDASNTERFRIDSTGATKIVTGIVTTLTATTGIVTTLTANTVTSLGDVKSTAGIVDIRSGSSINTNVTGGSASGTLHKNTTSGEFAIVSGGTGGNNHLSFYTSASAAPTEKLRIDSSGRLLLGTTTEGVSTGDTFTIATSSNTGMTIRSGTSNEGNIFFSDATSGSGEYAGSIQYNHGSNFLTIGTNTIERLSLIHI